MDANEFSRTVRQRANNVPGLFKTSKRFKAGAGLRENLEKYSSTYITCNATCSPLLKSAEDGLRASKSRNDQIAAEGLMNAFNDYVDFLFEAQYGTSSVATAYDMLGRASTYSSAAVSARRQSLPNSYWEAYGIYAAVLACLNPQMFATGDMIKEAVDTFYTGFELSNVPDVAHAYVLHDPYLMADIFADAQVMSQFSYCR